MGGDGRKALQRCRPAGERRISSRTAEAGMGPRSTLCTHPAAPGPTRRLQSVEAVGVGKAGPGQGGPVTLQCVLAHRSSPSSVSWPTAPLSPAAAPGGLGPGSDPRGEAEPASEHSLRLSGSWASFADPAFQPDLPVILLFLMSW